MLDSTQVRLGEDFERDGVLFPSRVLDDDQLSRCRAALEEIGARLGGPVKRLDWAHLFFDWAFEMTTHPRVVEPIAAILGPDVVVLSSRLLCKYPGDASFVGWHQDGFYSKLHSTADQFPSVTAWIALTDATLENGCLRVIPGSHRHGTLPHVETYATHNLTNHGEEVSVPFHQQSAVDVVLKAGEMSLHDIGVVHGSGANRSDTTRVGYSVSYATPAMGRSRWPVVLACGCREARDLDRWSAVPGSTTQDALARHAEFVQRHGLQASRLS